MNGYAVYSDELCHYGVKGMKWGVRHDPQATEVRSNYRHMRNAKRDYRKARQSYRVAKKDMRLAKKAYKSERKAYKRSLADYKALVERSMDTIGDTPCTELKRKHQSAIDTGKRYASSVKESMSKKLSEIRERHDGIDYIEDE